MEKKHLKPKVKHSAELKPPNIGDGDEKCSPRSITARSAAVIDQLKWPFEPDREGKKMTLKCSENTSRAQQTHVLVFLLLLLYKTLLWEVETTSQPSLSNHHLGFGRPAETEGFLSCN